MAAAEILAINTTAANSTDQTVAAGDQLTVCLKDAAGPAVGSGARVDILLKDDSGQYFAVGSLTGGKPAVVITGAGVYRFTRFAGVSCGVFSG
jgi:hypothetical protein